MQWEGGAVGRCEGCKMGYGVLVHCVLYKVVVCNGCC